MMLQETINQVLSVRDELRSSYPLTRDMQDRLAATLSGVAVVLMMFGDLNDIDFNRDRGE